LFVALAAQILAHVVVAADLVVFGPVSYIGNGRPQLSRRTFPLASVDGTFKLRVRNKGVVAALVVLNDRLVLGPWDFAGRPLPTERPIGGWKAEWDRLRKETPGTRFAAQIERPVALKTGTNELFVGFIARTGTSFTVEILRTSGLDTTPPAIEAAVTPAPNAHGWHNAPVTVTFTCTDAESGIASCPEPVTVTSDGGGHAVAGTAVDVAGNSATTTVTVNLDTIAPAVTAARTPAANANGWNNAPVTVTFAATDATSGVEPGSTSAPVVIATEGSGQSASGTARDLAGNVGSATVSDINVDASAPAISVALTPDANSAGYRNTPVTAHFTCGDVLSGVSSCPADRVISSEGTGQTVTETVEDRAGNVGTVTSPPFSIDMTPPVVTAVLTPSPNGQGWNNTPVTVQFTCVDGGSGVETCPPEEVVTSDGGNQLVTGTATDRAGNIAGASASVSIDRGPPTVALTSPASGAVVFTPTVNASGPATDGLSGVHAVTCNGLPGSIIGGAINCSVPVTPGPNSIHATVTDRAGNSASASTSVTYNRVPGIAITTPANLSYLNITPTTVSGTVDDGTASVTINTIEAPVADGMFSIALPIAEGPNLITATATSAAGAVGTATVNVTLDTTPPRVTITSPPDQFTTTESSISVAGIINDIVVGTVNPEQAGVKVNGGVAAVANRTFLAADVPLSVGQNIIRAVGVDRVGNEATTEIVVTRQTVTQAQIRAISGNNQTAAIGSPLAAPLVVAVTDAAGTPVAGRPVIFKVLQNDGLVVAGGAPAATVIANTGADGRAKVEWTLGGRAGAGGNAVEAYCVGFEGTALFTATGTLGPAGKIVVDTGNDQIGAIDRPLPKPFIAVVVDTGNNRLGGVPVTFTVQEGGGSFDGEPTYTVTTDSDGRAAATLTLGNQEGNANNVVSATFPSNAGFPAAFTASGRAPGNPANTTVSGVVLNNSNIPVEGVTVRAVSLTALRSSILALHSATAVVTNAKGQFTVPDAPVGAVKLFVDGTTVPPTGTYPSLEYDIVTVAGQNNTVGQPIYILPLKSENQLCVTAATGGGTLTIPEAPGFSLTFGPGQVTFPGGSKSGCINVTVVNGDKVPMAPGFGQQPRFIVTIQPAGAMFNPPAAITLPNVDGLKPRAVTEMYSFDHDISSFVAIGTGTVSDDGLVIRSNPGVGVLKAGWHCGGDPAARGTVADCPPCNWCQAAAPGPGGSDQCVFDPAQDGQQCNGKYNSCIVPGTGTCAQDQNSTDGVCVGGAPLPDGTPCNSAGSTTATCQQGVCVGNGTQCPVSCDDSDDCTIDSCANGTCIHTPYPQCGFCRNQPDGTICNSGGSATGSCNSGQCIGRDQQCPTSCADGSPFTADRCSDGVCFYEHDPEGRSCGGVADGTSCGANGICVSGLCSEKPVTRLTVWVKSFIPYHEFGPLARLDPLVFDPVTLNPFIFISLLDLYGLGDGRSFSGDRGASYRSRHVVQVQMETMTIAETKDVSQSSIRDVITNRVFSSPHPPTDTLHSTVTSGDGVIRVRFRDVAKSAFYVIPSIDLDLTATVNVENGSCKVTGTHDGFPAYELYVEVNDGQPIPCYRYDPGPLSYWYLRMLKLLPPMDIIVP
jgi:hypothetical protein